MSKFSRLVRRQRWFGGQLVVVPKPEPADELADAGCQQTGVPRRLVQLNFSVPVEFKQAMKTAAARDDKTLVQVLQEAFALYQSKHTIEP